MEPSIKTRIFVLSDTHGDALKHATTAEADVVIHCGDLTEESKLHEFETAIKHLQAIDAPLKLVIGGNHDFTLDDTAFERNIREMDPSIEAALLHDTYGRIGDSRRLLGSVEAKAAGIVYLEEGVHRFRLKNGALLTVYASPYTPSLSNGWGFTYNPQNSQEHDWNIDSSVDIAITHGPARGVLDYTHARTRAGSASLFAALARARPAMHCFGHIHEAWGAKLVTWKSEISEVPSHFTDIDQDQSTLLESLQTLRRGRFDSDEDILAKRLRCKRYEMQGHCDISTVIRAKDQTLFVNAAVEGAEDNDQHFPWLVTIDLPPADTFRG